MTEYATGGYITGDSGIPYRILVERGCSYTLPKPTADRLRELLDELNGVDKDGQYVLDLNL